MRNYYRQNPEDELRNLEIAALNGDEDAAWKLYQLRIRMGLTPTLPALRTPDRYLIERHNRRVDEARLQIARQHEYLLRLQKQLREAEERMALLIISELEAEQTEDPKWEKPFWRAKESSGVSADEFSLQRRRSQQADRVFEGYEFDEDMEVEAVDGWESASNSNTWTRKVFVANPSRVFIFHVIFQKDTNLVVDRYLTSE